MDDYIICYRMKELLMSLWWKTTNRMTDLTEFYLSNLKNTRSRQSVKTQDHILGIYTKQFQSGGDVGAQRNLHGQKGLALKNKKNAIKLWWKFWGNQHGSNFVA